MSSNHPANKSRQSAERSLRPAVVPIEKAISELEDISGIGEVKADALRKSGYQSPRAVEDASIGELCAVEGVGNAAVHRIKAELEAAWVER